MNKKKAKKKPSNVQSKRPSFKILRAITMIVVGTVLILAIISIAIKYYQLVFKK